MNENEGSGIPRFRLQVLQYLAISLFVSVIFFVFLNIADVGNMLFRVCLGMACFVMAAGLLALFQMVSVRRDQKGTRNTSIEEGTQRSVIQEQDGSQIQNLNTGPSGAHSTRNKQRGSKQSGEFIQPNNSNERGRYPKSQGVNQSSTAMGEVSIDWAQGPSTSITSVAPPLAAQTHCTGPVLIWAASRIGSRHLRGHQIRQDAFGTRVSEGLYLAVVADGVGSTPDADRAANAAVKAALKLAPAPPTGSNLMLARQQWKAITSAFVNDIQQSMNNVNRRRTQASEVSSTTIVVALLKPVSPRMAWVFWLSVGDSAIVRIRPDQRDFEYMNMAPLSGEEGTEALP